MRRPALARLAVGLLSTLPISGLLTAQGAQSVRGTPIVLGPAVQHAPPPFDVPAPPRAALDPRKPVTAPLPVVPSTRPQPTSPPTDLAQFGPDLPCDLVSHTRSTVRPAGASVHTVGEPSVALVGRTMADADTAFYTGNQFAGVSLDGGQSWTHVNPYTRFPSIDGGFCCDQRTLYVPSHDFTCWVLLYYPDPTRGSIRLATSLGRAGLRGDVWQSIVINPQPFGFPTGYWFDFPDIATTDTHLYVTVNVITPTPWQNVDSLVLKLPLDALRSGGAIRSVFWTRGQTLGPGRNYRLAQGATHTMFFGTLIDTATVRVFRNPDRSDVLTMVDRPVALYNNQDSGYVSRLRNGVNWADRALPFVKGAYATDREYGLLWHSALHGNRPLPYVRITRFSTADDSLIAEEDLWSPNLAWLYPAATSNAVGHIAVTAAAGGVSLDPVSTVLIVDDCQPTFAGFPVAAFAQSTHPPSYAGWGDYFSMQRHPARTLTFVTSGLAQAGGSATTDQAPQFMHFGRLRDQLAWSSVIIKSTGTVGVQIGFSPRDELSQTAVATPGYGSWQVSAGYSLAAPAQHVAGARTFEFQRWRHRAAPHAAWTDLPNGQRTLTVAAIGADDDTAEAVYAERIAGRATSFGVGCPGSTALVPTHAAAAAPEIGTPLTLRVSGVFGATAGVLCVGGSDAQWGTIALPLRLDFLGADPRCHLLVAADVIAPLPVDATGSGSLVVGVPNDPFLIGARLFSQVVVLDPGVSSPTKLVLSNGLELNPGGLR